MTNAPSKHYLAGLHMLDLGATGGARPSFRGRAVVHHPDDRVARVLTLLLRQEGFGVDRVGSLTDARVAADRAGVVLVVVARPSVGSTESPLSGFRGTENRPYGLVLLGASGDADPLSGADVEIPIPFDPAQLIEQLRQAARGSAT